MSGREEKRLRNTVLVLRGTAFMQALTTALYCFISKEDDTVENRGLEHP
jgi:hypothetical protein